MWWRRAAVTLAGLALLGACSGEAEQPEPTRGDGAGTPVAAVEEVHAMVRDGDFDGAANLTVPNHAALASLAEGATFADVADALAQGDLEVAANFWSGFAQAAGDSFLADVEAEDLGATTSGSSTFAVVGIASDDFGSREVVTQDVDGYRVDLFASFGGGLAPRMLSPVEILLTSATDDARLILAELEGVVASLEIAAANPELTADEMEAVLQLIGLITRVG